MSKDATITTDPSEPISLEDLRMFLAVARSGSFRSAAAQLFVSQPTLSRAIARLEEQLDARILDRGPRGVVLTENGEVLVEGARSVLSAAAALKRDVGNPRHESITIGATATSAQSILAPFLSIWIPEHPDARITAIEDNDTELLTRLENGDCDAAIISADTTTRVESLRLGTVAVNAMVTPNHRLAGESGPVSVMELGQEPLLVNGRGFPSTNYLFSAMEKAGAAPNVAFQCSAGSTLASMAAAGLGVAVFGATAVLPDIGLHSRPVVDGRSRPLSFDLYVAWRKSSASSLVRNFSVGLATFTRSRISNDPNAVLSR